MEYFLGEAPSVSGGFCIRSWITHHFTLNKRRKWQIKISSTISKYFCAIPPFFYACTAIWRFVSGNSVGGEYFFPPLTNSNDDHASDVWEIFQIIDIRSVSWVAVLRCIPTMIALVLFSLIHVPINIPAFAVSSNVEVNMNVELMAHGYSIFFAGVLGGAFNHGLTVS
jgi:SulP family sulfate permease